jgi:hypothetical protein
VTSVLIVLTLTVLFGWKKTKLCGGVVTMTDNVNEVFELIENSFEEFMKDYELDGEGSINDMLFEVFCAGFESGAHLELVEEEE